MLEGVLQDMVLFVVLVRVKEFREDKGGGGIIGSRYRLQG